MTIIQPLTAAGIGTVVLRPLPDVQPFSIQSGYSFEGILSDMRTWLRDVLVPYLEDNSAQAIFQSNVDTMIDTVNTALTQQSQTVTTALNAAVAQVIAGAVPVEDALILAVLNAATSTTRDWFAIAPAPSGGDDTAVLQELVTEAQGNGGTIYLRAGTYHANLETLDAFQQVTLIGRGKVHTIIQAVTKTKPTFRFKGMTLAGGGLHNLSLRAAPGGGGIGLEHLGASGTNSHGIGFLGDDSPNATGGATLPFDIGWHLYNRDAGTFSEDNYVEAEFLDCNQPVFYEVLNGDASFSGSGLVGNSVINLSEIVPNQVAITIGPNAFPYNAPCTALVHGQAADQVVFNNLNTGRKIGFYGDLHTEGINTIALNGDIWYLGGLSQLVAAGGTAMGSFWLVEKLLHSAGQFSDKAQFKPFQRRVPMLSNQAADLTPAGMGSCIVQAEIVGPNYHQTHLLHCWDSPYSTTGVVSMMANPESLDAAGHGVPAYSWVNNRLHVTLPNNEDTTNVFAYVSVVPMRSFFEQYAQYQN